ncbi:MAG: hypothetical protein NVS9B1_21830 [Candidatus Dormibacteraceae bacterium]
MEAFVAAAKAAHADLSARPRDLVASRRRSRYLGRAIAALDQSSRAPAPTGTLQALADLLEAVRLEGYLLFR